MAELHISPIRTYLGILSALIVLTFVTVWVAFLDFGPFNDVVAVSIAVFKASLVVMFFMHVKYSTRLIGLIAVGSVFFLLVLFAFTLSDFLTRGLVIS